VLCAIADGHDEGRRRMNARPSDVVVFISGIVRRKLPTESKGPGFFPGLSVLD
jgi:hypothetical protein